MKLKHNKYWFKPKTYGYGAQPITWEGWALVAGYVVIIFALAYFVLPKNAESFYVGLFLSIITLWKISMDKTEEKWTWRWKK